MVHELVIQSSHFDTKSVICGEKIQQNVSKSILGVYKVCRKVCKKMFIFGIEAIFICKRLISLPLSWQLSHHHDVTDDKCLVSEEKHVP